MIGQSRLTNTMALLTDLSSHLALITGATGGIGQASALALGRMGCNIAVHVCILLNPITQVHDSMFLMLALISCPKGTAMSLIVLQYNSATHTASDLVKQLHNLGVKAQSFQADLSTYDGTRRLHAQVTSSMGNPTILFNNAGLTLKAGVGDISQISIDDFEYTWRANCGSSYLLTQLCIPSMVSAGFGRVIFCSSVAGFMGGVVGPHYASSKAALHGLVHWLANTYSKQGITVNAVAPALIEETKMLPGEGDRGALQASKCHARPSRIYLFCSDSMVLSLRILSR